MYQRQRLHRNVDRLFDTKGMNRISGKPLKTRGSGTLAVAGIPCLILGLCQGSMGAAVTDGHSGHKSDPSCVLENRFLLRLKKSSFLSIMKL